MREESSTGSLTDMADDVFAERLKSPEGIKILFNCLQNVERQNKGYLHISTISARPSN